MEEINIIKNLADPKGENMKYLILDLITENYDPTTLIKKAYERNVQQQLGFLANVTLEALQNKKLQTKRLEEILENISPSEQPNWVHLDPYCPEWGKKIIGTEIPIISEERGRKEKPDYFLILPWYFIEEFRIREKEYLEKGGKFIVPLPEFHIIDSK